MFVKLPAYSFDDIDIVMPVCTAVFYSFHPLSCDVLSSIGRILNKTTYVLDLFCCLTYQYYSMYCESLFLVWGFLTCCKSTINFTLIKNHDLDSEILNKIIFLLLVVKIMVLCLF